MLIFLVKLVICCFFSSWKLCTDFSHRETDFICGRCFVLISVRGTYWLLIFSRKTCCMLIFSLLETCKLIFL